MNNNIIFRLADIHDLERIMDIISKVVPIMNACNNWQWDQTYPNCEY